MEEKTPVIELPENGPLRVKGVDRLSDAAGNSLPTKAVFSLCRCGASRNKPFCDGAHRESGFSSHRETDKPIDKERRYEGKQITIHDNRGICSHAAYCVDRLPGVFRKGGRPWIDPDGAEAAAVIKVVESCPSGALSYTLGGKHVRDQAREAAITVEKNGPYLVTGAIELKCDLQPPSREHYALCRCGASRNKPYCDGRHHDISFDDA